MGRCAVYGLMMGLSMALSGAALAQTPSLADKCKDAPAPATAAKGKKFTTEVVPVAEDLAYAAFDEGCYVKAMTLAQAAAARGEAHAFTLIGQMHENGLGVPPSDAKAAEAYQKGAALGDHHAQFQLGMMFLKGRGVKTDPDAAVTLLEQAAAKNHSLAQYNLGLIYVEGEARPQDFARAAALFEKSAQQDNPRAQFDLAAMYAAGRGVPQDLAKAAHWTALAAKAGLTDAELEYGVILIHGRRAKLNGVEVEIVKKDERAGLKYLEAAAEKGSPVAQNRVARAYRFGVGADFDPVASAKWHLLARSSGKSDPLMDLFLASLPEQTRARAEAEADQWRERRAAEF
ncbi:MAG: tetratricopeptide repeat protein [Hyphomicrobiales bacterium]|nr:tetratricopeptide repeat protein [Hyphomicrobiales bacterium]